MKKIYACIAFVTCFQISKAQDLPIDFAPGEKEKMKEYLNSFQVNQQKTLFTSPPANSRLRNAAEWEEIQTLNITLDRKFHKHPS